MEKVKERVFLGALLFMTVIYVCYISVFCLVRNCYRSLTITKKRCLNLLVHPNRHNLRKYLRLRSYADSFGESEGSRHPHYELILGDVESLSEKERENVKKMIILNKDAVTPKERYVFDALVEVL